MIVRSATVGAVLGACLLFVSAARADEPKDKSLTEKAREQAQKGVRELHDAERSAREELKRAEQKVREAEQKLKGAAADAKQAAQEALSDAKRALEQAKLEASTAGDKAVGKAAELKSDVAEAAEKARTEAEGAAQDVAAEATTAVRNIEAKAQQIMQSAAGATGDARRRHARRAAWQKLSPQVQRPQDVPPGVRQELRRHAQRLARLERIRALANEKKEPALVTRADALRAREEQRHTKKLASLLAALPAQRGTDRARAAEEEDQDPADEPAEEEEEQP